MTFTFKGDDFGKVFFFALDTDLPNAYLVVELRVVESFALSTAIYKVIMLKILIYF